MLRTLQSRLVTFREPKHQMKTTANNVHECSWRRSINNNSTNKNEGLQIAGIPHWLPTSILSLTTCKKCSSTFSCWERKADDKRWGVKARVEEWSADSTSAAFSASLICCFNWSLLLRLTSSAGSLTELALNRVWLNGRWSEQQLNARSS